MKKEGVKFEVQADKGSPRSSQEGSFRASAEGSFGNQRRRSRRRASLGGLDSSELGKSSEGEAKAEAQEAQPERDSSPELDAALTSTLTREIAGSADSVKRSQAADSFLRRSYESTERADDEGAPKVKPPKAVQKAAEGFEPEALHVRSMLKAEKRNTERNRLKAYKRWSDEMATLDEIDKEHDPAQWEHFAVQCHRSKYHLDLLESRMKFLEAVDPATHMELPGEFIKAASCGDVEFVRLAFHAHVPVDAQDTHGTTALMAAMISNKVSCVELLLELDADPAIQDANGATCAHYAVQMGNIHSFRILLDTPPKKHWNVLTIKDSREKSALDYARTPDRAAFLELLRVRMGGAHAVLWQVFKGWLADTFMGWPCPCSRVERKKFVYENPDAIIIDESAL